MVVLSAAMLAGLPYPNASGIVPTTAALCNRKLSPRTKASTVLLAACQRLSPRCFVQTAAHAVERAAAYAKLVVVGPAQLRAA